MSSDAGPVPPGMSMNLGTVLFPCALAFSVVGVYLNLCYQRATHRSTLYPKFLSRNLRFISWMQICLAISNIVFLTTVWGSKLSRTKKSEALFSTALNLTRALPALSVFWVTVERVIFNRVDKIRHSPSYKDIVTFRIFQLVFTVGAEIVCKPLYEQNIPTNEEEGNLTTSQSLQSSNGNVDYYHAIMLIFPAIIALLIFHFARSSYKRAGLLGGMRNDQKIQSLRAQTRFFLHSYIPLFLGCSFDYILQLVVKRSVAGIEDEFTDIAIITARTFLPISYPVSLIALHSQLRTEYLTNFCLCRKAKHVHKESKVKVIATRESQESIIANLKMIGILSDVDNMPTTTAGPVPSKRPSSNVTRSTGISREPTSITSIGSMAKMSTASQNNVIVTSNNGGNNNMLFQPRSAHKNSLTTLSIVQ